MPPITVYATEDDLRTWGVNESALEGVDPVDIATALQKASDIAAGYLESQYVLPLEAVGGDLNMYTTWIAAYLLMTSIGYAPDMGQDNQFKQRYDEAIKWLTKVKGGMASAGTVGASTSGPGSGQAAGARPLVISSSQRGYSSRGDTGTPVVLHDLVIGGRGGFVGD